MPRYKKTSATGDAGEYYFAYWVTRHFGFPCRLQSVDLGIDALIELTNEHKDVKGELISVQIKTSFISRLDKKKSDVIDESKIKKQFDVSHLSYWDSSHLPVILVYIIFIDDEEPRMYVRNIDDEYIQEIISNLTPKQKRKEITFEKFQKFDMKYMKDLKAIYGIPDELLTTCKNIEKSWEGVNQMLIVDDRDNVSLINDFDDDALLNSFNEMCEYQEKIKALFQANQHLNDIPEVNLADERYEKLERGVLCMMATLKHNGNQEEYTIEWNKKIGLHSKIVNMISDW